MDEMAAFLQTCFERDLAGYPPIEQGVDGLPAAPPPSVAPPPGAARSAGPASVDASPASRHGRGPSAVFTVRIGRDDLALLEGRATAAGLSPSALARNLIHIGLQGVRTTAELSEAVARVESATAGLRAALP